MAPIGPRPRYSLRRQVAALRNSLAEVAYANSTRRSVLSAVLAIPAAAALPEMILAASGPDPVFAAIDASAGI